MGWRLRTAAAFTLALGAAGLFVVMSDNSDPHQFSASPTTGTVGAAGAAGAAAAEPVAPVVTSSDTSTSTSPEPATAVTSATLQGTPGPTTTQARPAGSSARPTADASVQPSPRQPSPSQPSPSQPPASTDVAAATPTADSSAPTDTTDSSATPAASPEASRPAVNPRGRLVFSDTFDSSSLDRTKWQTCYPWADFTLGCTNAGNNEQQWYVPAQVKQSNGALHLVADRAPTNGTTRAGAPTVFPYRSGMIASAGHFSFTYGYVEFVARIPKGDAMWPALWLLPADLTWPPEIDVMEAVGNNTTGVALTLHGTDGSKSQQFASARDFATAMHTFAIDWKPGSITWYVDGTAAFTATRGVPSTPMYLLANLAVGGTGGGPIGPGTPAHASFDLDSVKVWQR